MSSFTWGPTWVLFLTPFGLLAGWITAEIALFASRFILRSLPPPRARAASSVSTGAIAIIVSPAVGLAFGLQVPLFYACVFVLAVGSVWVGLKWLNKAELPPAR